MDSATVFKMTSLLCDSPSQSGLLQRNPIITWYIMALLDVDTANEIILGMATSWENTVWFVVRGQTMN